MGKWDIDKGASDRNRTTRMVTTQVQKNGGKGEWDNDEAANT
jgi:hypothetical protein